MIGWLEERENDFLNSGASKHVNYMLYLQNLFTNEFTRAVEIDSRAAFCYTLRIRTDAREFIRIDHADFTAPQKAFGT